LLPLFPFLVWLFLRAPGPSDDGGRPEFSRVLGKLRLQFFDQGLERGDLGIAFGKRRLQLRDPPLGVHLAAERITPPRSCRSGRFSKR
jgi:hypothetical protein